MSVWVGVLLVYAGLFGLGLGLISLLKPLPLLRVRSRRAAAAVLALGAVLAVVGAALPAPLQRPGGPATRLDEFVPAFQFREVHATRIHAPPDRVFRALHQVTASEIRFFRVLTWIRSPRFRPGGQETILNAPAEKPILEVALKSGFQALATQPDRELVFGTLLDRRRPGFAHLRAEDFIRFDQPGHAKAVMNFYLEDEGLGWCRLRTETRVYATDDSACRRFAVYWRLIYPGSALIRVMWLEAVKKRAEAAAP